MAVRKGADKQTSEMTEPFLRGGSCSEREEGEEEFTEHEARVGKEPTSSTRISGQDVANVAVEANAELAMEARRRRALRQM